MPYKVAFAPHFGIFHLNLDDAGLLIAKCMWFRGEVKTDPQEVKAYHFFDRELERKLSDLASQQRILLCCAIEEGRLTPSRLQRRLDGSLVTDKTFVDALVLADWLEDCGIALGEVFEDEYLRAEEELAHRMTIIVAAERAQQKTPKNEIVEGDDLRLKAENLILMQRLIHMEQAQAETPAHAPISEKQRGAYLNIIGGLLGLLLGKSPAGKAYSVFESQQAIIDAIHGLFGEAPGLSQRNLADKFAESKRVLQSTSKS